MSSEVLLVPDCNLGVKESLLLTKQNIIFEIALHTELHLLLSETYMGARWIVNISSVKPEIDAAVHQLQ